MAVYVFSFSGLPLSPDEYIMFDTAQSLVLHGTMGRTIGFNVDPTIQEDGTPWPPPKYEPLQILAVAPLFWIGHHLPDIGRLHTVFTLNIFVTTLTALSLYPIALQRGYSPSVAWFGALIFGVATAAWPYSRWLFREPLMALFVLWAFHIASQIPHRITLHQSVWRQALLVALLMTGAILTKQISWLLLPAISICLFPTHITWRRVLPVVVILAVMLVGLILLILFLRPVETEGRYSIAYWTNSSHIDWRSMPESFLGYQISPARSLWLFSPVLIVGWFGAAMLLRQKEWRAVIGPAITIVLVGASYGATRQEAVWNGGWGWGPRYMVPFLPLLMLWVLPILQWLFRKPTTLYHHAAWLSFIGLIVVSVGMQWLGLATPYTDYYIERQSKFPDAHLGGDQAWADTNWVWGDSQIPYHWEHFNGEQLQPAWTIVETEWVVPILTLMMGLLGLGLSYPVYFHYRHTRLFHFVTKAGLVPIAMLLPLIPLSIGLHQVRDDERYIKGQADVLALIAFLNEQTTAEDIVFIEDGNYSRLFMNYFKSDALLMTLPTPLRGGYTPGEPEIGNDDLYDAIGYYAGYALDWGASHHHRLWLVATSGPSTPNAIRPAERLLTVRYYPAQTFAVSQAARAILFLTDPVPITPPAFESSFAFDGQMGLLGFDLPRGTVYHQGDSIPVSLAWSPLQPMITNYSISLRMTDATHFPYSWQEGTPMGTFGYTAHWRVNEVYRDNRVLSVPADLPPGEYYLEVRVTNDITGQWLTARDLNTPGTPLNPSARLMRITLR